MQDSQTNTFTKGMNLDVAKEYVSSDLYIYATDVHVTGDRNSYGTLLEYDEIYEYVKNNTNIQELYEVLGVTSGKKYHNGSVVECVIVFSVAKTISSGGAKKKNKLEAFLLPENVSNQDDFKLTSIFELEYKFDIDTDVKLINVYENEKVSRVYIAAESKHINVVNINKDYTSNNVNNDYDFSIFPKCGLLKPFTFDCELVGSLTAGKYQYAYLLFNSDGQTSALSIISHPILVGQELKEDLTQIGIRVKVDMTQIMGSWEYIRIYSIVYTDNTNVPQVYVKAELEFTKPSEFYWADLSNGFINVLTLEEFNAIKNTVFSANTIETKDNMLFAAGIQFEDFDVDFDARAFPADSNGWVKFTHPKNVELVEQEHLKKGWFKLEEDDDCYIQDTDFYKYNTLHGKVKPYIDLNGLTKEQYPFGGAGPNVEYMFEHPVWYLSPFSAKADNVKDKITGNVHSDARYVSENITENNKFTKSGIKIELLRMFYPLITDEASDWNYTPNHQIKGSHTVENLNHSDTYLCANFTGFKQGEVYRFGIVFYNNRMQRSPVHWINDITIPRSDNWIFSGVVEKDIYGEDWSHDLIASGVGITFRVSLPEKVKNEIVGFEIVRCDRTAIDRTILCQGICSRTLRYKSRNANNTNPYLPSCIPSMCAIHGIDKDSAAEYEHAMFYERLLTFDSPEVSTNKENIEPFVKTVAYFRPVADLSSYIVNREQSFEADHSYLGVFKYLRLGTAPDEYESDHDEMYSGGSWFGTIQQRWINWIKVPSASRFIFADNDPNTAKLGIFKFYQACNNYGNAGYYKIAPSAVQYVDGLDFTASDATITTSSVAVGSHLYCNLGMSNNDDPDGEGSHGPCLVLEFSEDDALKYIVKNSPQGTNRPNSNHGIQRWGYYWNFPQKDSFMYNITNPYDATLRDESFILYNDWYYDGDEDEDKKYADIRELESVGNVASSNRKKLYLSRLTNSVVLADLYTKNTPYNGFTHSARTNSTYISTGLFFEVSSNDVYCSCYGGDTYIVLNEALWQQYVIGPDNALSDDDKATIIVKYPVETTINVYKAAGPKYSDNPYTVGHFFEPTVAGKFSQDKPYAAYNDAYSAHEVSRVHVLKGIWDISNQYIPNRIINSEVKSTGELTDSFLEFKVANYIDVDNKFGNVTNLVNFNNNLIFFQDNAVGYLSVNERSLIEDNQSALLLGTGGVLTAFTYYSQFFGTSVINDTSIVKAPAALYWYDNAKQNIYALNNGIESLSLVKGAQSYLFDFSQNNGEVLPRLKMFSAYDTHNREVWFRLQADDKSLIYSEHIGLFVGFYSRPIQHSATMSDNTVSFTETGVLSIGKHYKNVDYWKGAPSVTFVVNKNPNITKVFDAIQTSSSNSTGEVFCNYIFKTNRQNVSTVSQNNANRFMEGVCYTYVPRDHNKERLRDRYMMVTMDFDNTNKFYIPNVSTIFRRSLH